MCQTKRAARLPVFQCKSCNMIVIVIITVAKIASILHPILLALQLVSILLESCCFNIVSVLFFFNYLFKLTNLLCFVGAGSQSNVSHASLLRLWYPKTCRELCHSRTSRSFPSHPKTPSRVTALPSSENQRNDRFGNLACLYFVSDT